METQETVAVPIDFNRLREVSDGDAELMNDLIELYFSQTREQLDALKAAVSEKKFDVIYSIAHKIVGGSLTCGMNAIVPSIQQLEKIGKSQTDENAEQLFAEAQNSFEQMEEFLKSNG